MIALRSAVLVATALLLSPCAALSQALPSASSQSWPNRTVTMLVPLPAGGIADLMARGCAQALSDEFGQPFVVENRPGASGNLAAAAVVKAPPDGGVLLFATQAQAAFNKMMFESLPYDPARDLVPVVLVLKSPVVFVGALAGPVTSFQAMLDYARTNPGKLTSGQTGVGSMSHVAFEMLQQKTGIVLNGVPYKGGAPMVTDLLGGHPAFELHSSRQGQESPAARGRHRAAVQRSARCADRPGRDQNAVRSRRMVHDHGARRHAARRGAEGQCGGEPVPRERQGQRADRRCCGRSRRRHARRSRRLCEERDRQMDAGDQGGADFAELGHDPEKCEAVFGNDHAQTREGATDLIQRN
jgi:hypothetical protein